MNQITLKKAFSVVAICVWIALLALWFFNSRALDKTDVALAREQAMVRIMTSLHEVRYDVVQIQQFLTDVSATGDEDGFKDAKEHLESALQELDKLKQLEPTKAGEFTQLGNTINKLHTIGTEMARAYIAHGKEAGNTIMKRPVDGLDAASEALATQLASLSAKYEQGVPKTEQQTRELMSQTKYLIIGFGLLIPVLMSTALYVLYHQILLQLGAEPVKASEIVGSIASGNLDTEIRPGRGEHSLLTRMKTMLDKLYEVLTGIDSTNRQLGQSAFQVAQLAGDISQSSDVQKRNFARVAQATEQLSASSNEVNQMSISVLERSIEAARNAQEGIQALHEQIAEMGTIVTRVNDAEASMNRLVASTGEVDRIIATISGIADQTNLLSLNASIEAARAGESGRGFAVVADEVRKLAGRTAEATQEIATIIQQFVSEIRDNNRGMKDVVGLVEAGQAKSTQTATIIERMVVASRETATANERISTSSLAQVEELQRFADHLTDLSKALEDTESKVRVTYEIGNDLHKTAERVAELMAYFRFDRKIRLNPAQHEKRQSPRAEHSLLVNIETRVGIVQAVAADFSMGGICLRSAVPLAVNKNEDVSLALLLPEDNYEAFSRQKPVQLKGAVKWHRQSEGLYLCGIEFLPTQGKAHESLQQCFDYFNIESSFDFRK